jgi:hypothetical protein
MNLAEQIWYGFPSCLFSCESETAETALKPVNLLQLTFDLHVNDMKGFLVFILQIRRGY